MANDLNASLRARLAGPVIPHKPVWSFTYEITDGVSTIDIGDRFVAWRSFDLTLANWHPSAPDSAAQITYAGLQVEVTNPDGYFTEGHADSVFGSDPITDWQLVISIYEHASDADGVLFAELIGDLTTAPNPPESDTAVLTAVAEIGRIMAEIQDYDAMTFVVDKSGLTGNKGESDVL